MLQRIINKCPSCGNEMSITTLGCKNCGIEIKGEFELSLENDNNLSLSDEELELLKLFLKHTGNISKIQEEYGISYFAAKDKIKALSKKIGNEEDDTMKDFTINVNSTGKGLASQRIIQKLNNLGGKTNCPMLRGADIVIWLTENGVANSGFENLVCEWEVFDSIVEKATELGGRMYRGDGAAQSGAKVGSKELPLDTIDAYISIKYYDGEIGKSTTRRSTYYAAILAWAGICANYRSDGNGGYIILNPEWR